MALSSVFSFRASRDESEIKDIIGQIKSEGDRLDAHVREEYEVSVPEAIERLAELEFGLMGLITAISTRIPRTLRTAQLALFKRAGASSDHRSHG